MNENSPSEVPAPGRSAFFLRRLDQPAVAMVLCISAILIGLFVVRLGQTKQGVIDIDRRTQRGAQLHVDLNSAPWPEFASLPGIGEFLGRTIVDYRQDHGNFRAIDEIKRVPGIGEMRYQQIKTFLVIQDPDAR